MDKMIYVAMSGARQIMLKQASNNHNLANGDTIGFKAEIDNFRSVPVYGPGHPVKVYGQEHQHGADFTAGTIMQTGNPLDVSLDGGGFIAVQGEDGEELYTRAGSLRVSATGLLETRDGHPVLGNGGPITLSPYEDLLIGKDGTITIRPIGQGAAELAILDRIKLVNPDTGTLTRQANGYFSSENADEPADAAVTLSTESLETSNVNTVEALVTMIELARSFETQVKLMKTAENNATSAARLLQTN